MYFVLDAKTEETIAMTRKADVAEMIKEMTKEPAVIRYTKAW